MRSSITLRIALASKLDLILPFGHYHHMAKADLLKTADLCKDIAGAALHHDCAPEFCGPCSDLARQLQAARDYYRALYLHTVAQDKHNEID